MGVGSGIFLIAIGAILTFALESQRLVDRRTGGRLGVHPGRAGRTADHGLVLAGPAQAGPDPHRGGEPALPSDGDDAAAAGPAATNRAAVLRGPGRVPEPPVDNRRAAQSRAVCRSMIGALDRPSSAQASGPRCTASSAVRNPSSAAPSGSRSAESSEMPGLWAISSAVRAVGSIVRTSASNSSGCASYAPGS